MGSAMQVLSHEHIAATEDHTEMTREERSVSVKDVLVVLSISCASVAPIAAVIYAVIYYEVELPPFLRDFLIQPFSYM